MDNQDYMGSRIFLLVVRLVPLTKDEWNRRERPDKQELPSVSNQSHPKLVVLWCPFWLYVVSPCTLRREDLFEFRRFGPFVRGANSRISTDLFEFGRLFLSVFRQGLMALPTRS
jgi:hypothetical protein